MVFGSESSGIPEPLLAAAPERCERIPMLRDCDSLDNAEAWEAHEESLGHTEDSHEAILQQDICGNFINPDDYRISALNLSNSAAIVLYEALRQTGFPGMYKPAIRGRGRNGRFSNPLALDKLVLASM